MQTQATTSTVTAPTASSFEVRIGWLADAPTLTINIDATTARRRVSGWVGREVSYMMGAGAEPPQLVIERTGAFWHVPVVPTSSKVGLVGKVGEVRVNAESGEVIANLTLIESLTAGGLSLANVAQAL